MQAPETTSTRPYMVRAMYDWCVDNNCTPLIVVSVDASVRVPSEFVQNGEIVLNVSMGATSNLSLGNDFIEFKARFGGVARDICVPLGRVSAIYARENGQGMAFPVHDDDAPVATLSAVNLNASQIPSDNEPTPPSTGPSRPALKRIK